MLQAIRRLTAAAALGAGLALAAATGANAAVTVTLTPTTATAGTTVTVVAASCSETAAATVKDTDLNVNMPVANGQAQGSFVVPSEWKAGMYTIAVRGRYGLGKTDRGRRHGREDRIGLDGVEPGDRDRAGGRGGERSGRCGVVVP